MPRTCAGGKLGLHETWGLPRGWVGVPEGGSPRLRLGLTISPAGGGRWTASAGAGECGSAEPQAGRSGATEAARIAGEDPDVLVTAAPACRDEADLVARLDARGDDGSRSCRRGRGMLPP